MSQHVKRFPNKRSTEALWALAVMWNATLDVLAGQALGLVRQV